FYEEAVAIERELGDPGRLAEVLYNRAFFIAGDDIEAAARMIDESLDLFRQAGDERGMAQALTMLVIRDAQAGEWGRVTASLEGDPVAEARAHLSDDAAKRAWEEGLAMDVDEAIALAHKEAEA